jgi:hypothetical protein
MAEQPTLRSLRPSMLPADHKVVRSKARTLFTQKNRFSFVYVDLKTKINLISQRFKSVLSNVIMYSGRIH